MAQTDLTAADVVRAWREPAASIVQDFVNLLGQNYRLVDCEQRGLYDGLCGITPSEWEKQTTKNHYDHFYALGVEARRLMEENRNAD